MGEPNSSINLAHLIDDHDASIVALISRNRATTYGELRDQIARLRGGLSARGIGVGDRVAILCGNNRYFVVSYLATIGLGAVAVPLNPASPPAEITAQLAVVEPSTVIVGPSAIGNWHGVDRSAVPSVSTVVCAESDDEAAADDAVALHELLESEPTPIVDVDPDDLAVLMFTSGTAGTPRAAMLSHRNLRVNVDQSLSAHDHTCPGDVVYGVLPMFHIFGLNVMLAMALEVGATLVLVQRFDPATAAESIVERRVTVLPGAPPMWVAFAHFDELPADTFSSVRIAGSGAARLSPSVLERMRDRFGLDIAEGYGLTEASPVVTSSTGLPVRPGSVGRLVTGVEMRLVGNDGHDVPVGDAGEIWVRGDNVFHGYLDDPEATAAVLAEGWLHTGDVGVVDSDGYLYLVDRAKDLIIVSGFNVFPAEVEEVLLHHPAIVEAGVVGVPHPHQGEAVKAFVVAAEGFDLDEDAVIEHCLDFLARYKCPTKVMFVDELPRNAGGKLKRRELDNTVLAD